jgi:RsmE family RNA methyltransferase
MNCLLFEAGELDRETMTLRLDGRRRRHADEILRAREGDRLRVGEIDGQMGEGEIQRLDREVLELRVRLESEPPPKRPLRLVLALPRPPVFRRLLSTVASLGAESILVVGTARTEGSFWQSRVLDPDAIRDRLLLGLEQARDTRLPSVRLHRYFESLVEEQLPAWVEGRRALLAHPGSGKRCPHAVKEPVTLFVGPEGGFIDHEVERLNAIGFEAVDLGPRILRVEPVIPLLVGRLFE